VIIAREITINEYAIYTVGIIMSSAIALLASGATSSVATNLFGEQWSNTTNHSRILTGTRQRQTRIFLIATSVLTPLALYLLWKNLQPIPQSLLVWSVIVLFTYTDQYSKISSIYLNFRKKQSVSQGIEAACSTIKLAFAVTTIFFTVSATVFVRLLWIEYIVRRSISNGIASGVTEVASELNVKMRTDAYIHRQIATDIYYCGHHQLTLLLTSTIGGPAVTAAFGAINRIWQVLSSLGFAVSSLVLPFVSRNYQGSFRAYILLSAAAAVPGVGLVFFSQAVPSTILFALGPNYESLTREVQVASLYFGYYFWVSTTMSLLQSQGRNKYAWTYIPTSTVLTGASLLVMRIDSLTSIYLFLLVCSLAMLPPILLETMKFYRFKQSR